MVNISDASREGIHDGSKRAPVGVAIAVVVAQQVNILLRILGDLQRLVDRVEQIVRQVRREVDEFCAARRGLSGRAARGRPSCCSPCHRAALNKKPGERLAAAATFER